MASAFPAVDAALTSDTPEPGPAPEQPNNEQPERPTRPRGLWPSEPRPQAHSSAADDGPFTSEDARRWKLPQMDNWLAVRALSEAESKRLREDMTAGLRRYGRRADQLISATTRDGTPAHIWSAIPDDDLESLVDAWLELGKINKVAAQAARGFARVNKLADASIIVGLKLAETQQHYLLHGFEALGFGSVLAQMMAAGQNGQKASVSA